MEQQIQIKASDEAMKGVYSNTVLLANNKEEFILDFLSNSPQGAILLQRIFVSPTHAKRLQAALTENIDKYEKQFGSIEVAEDSRRKIGY